MIDETVKTGRITRAEQRATTRRALIEATVGCLVEEGYGALTTRRVAERAGVAQSTLMHHFGSREALLAEAIGDLALRLAAEALEEIDLAALALPEQRTAVLEQAWRKFTSPEGVAAAQVWIAAWSEPDLARVLAGLEQRVDAVVRTAASTLFPDDGDEPRTSDIITLAVSVILGLVIQIPVAGRRAVEARWRAIRPILAEAATPSAPARAGQRRRAG